MKYKEIRDLLIKESGTNNYREIIKGIISFEKNINDEETLNRIYNNYMDNDCSIFSDYMEDIIEEALDEEDEEQYFDINDLANYIEKESE